MKSHQILLVKNGLEPFEKRSDSLKRIELSYDYMIKALSNVNENDLIILSDNDEIPNLNSKQFKNQEGHINLQTIILLL